MCRSGFPIVTISVISFLLPSNRKTLHSHFLNVCATAEYAFRWYPEINLRQFYHVARHIVCSLLNYGGKVWYISLTSGHTYHSVPLFSGPESVDAHNRFYFSNNSIMSLLWSAILLSAQAEDSCFLRMIILPSNRATFTGQLESVALYSSQGHRSLWWSREVYSASLGALACSTQ